MASFVTSRARFSILASKSQILIRLDAILNALRLKKRLLQSLQLYKGHRSCNPHNFQNCFKEILTTESFFRKPFWQLNNWYVVKQRYKSLKVLYTIFWLWTSMSVFCASVQLIVFVLHLTFRGQHMVATSFFSNTDCTQILCAISAYTILLFIPSFSVVLLTFLSSSSSF